MSEKKPKRPRDINQLAKAMVDIAISENHEQRGGEIKSPEAMLGRIGGLKGGKARAKALSQERRSEIARLAARKRWHGDDE